MIIEQITIEGFGKLHKAGFRLQSGINLIYGNNESGKTTCQQFLLGMLYDVERLRGKGAKNDMYTRYLPVEGGKYGGNMTFEVEGEKYRLDRNFRKDQKEQHLYHLQTGREVFYDNRMSMEEFFGYMKKQEYLETLCIHSQQIRTGDYLRAELTQYLTRIADAGSAQFDVLEAISNLQLEKRQNQRNDKTRELKELKLAMGQFQDLEQERKMLYKEEQVLEQKLNQKQNKLEEDEESPEEVRSYPIFLGMAMLIFLFTGIFLWKHWVIIALFFFLIGTLMMRKWVKKPSQNEKDNGLSDTGSMVQLELERQLAENRGRQRYLLDQENSKEILRNKYKNLKKEQENLEYNNKAIELAIEKLKELSASMHDRFGGILNEEVSRIIAAITDQRYERVLIDEHMRIKVEAQQHFIDSGYLSLGTVEQIYLAVRLTAAKLIQSKESLPILIDDIFGSFDDERLAKTMEFLSECEYPQILLFTCDRRLQNILINQRTEFSYLEL